jgi:hypothetical protein
MKIEFYEEFPSEGNLSKLRSINFPTKIFIAAKSTEEFRKYEKIAKEYKKNLEVAYWPIIKNSYWISPFSNTEDLIVLFKELNNIKNKLLIDLELPLKHRWKRCIRNIFCFKKNKNIIKIFLEQNKKRVTTAEYASTILSNIMKLLGLNYDVDYERSIMWYSSMFPNSLNKKVKDALYKLKRKENYSVSLGTIASGILGNEIILSPENLEKDLKFVKKCGFKKVVIFRLEGLNQDYLRVLNKFI